MTNTYEVVSAFLDDEPFDPDELSRALSDPEGRALLIDLIALRHVVQPEDGITARPGPRLAWRPLAAAAAMLVALAGGYVIGERQSSAAIDEPPAPTRVVETTEWQTVPGGGGR